MLAHLNCKSAGTFFYCELNYYTTNALTNRSQLWISWFVCTWKFICSFILYIKHNAVKFSERTAKYFADWHLQYTKWKVNISLGEIFPCSQCTPNKSWLEAFAWRNDELYHQIKRMYKWILKSRADNCDSIQTILIKFFL